MAGHVTRGMTEFRRDLMVRLHHRPGSKPPHHERREDAPNDQRKRRQFLRGFQARPGDRARHAAHRDGRRYEPVHRALRLALRRAVVGRVCAKHRLSRPRRSTTCSSSTSCSARPCRTSRGTPSPISATPICASSSPSIPATRSRPPPRSSGSRRTRTARTARSMCARPGAISAASQCSPSPAG